MSWDFFISFSTKDKDRVSQIVKLMERQGATCWFQLKDSKQDYLDAIANGIDNSNAFIVFLSPNSAISKPVRNEIKYALDINIKVLPIIISGEINDSIFNAIKLLIGTLNCPNVKDKDCNTDEKLVAKIFNQLDYIPKNKSDKILSTSNQQILEPLNPVYIGYEEFKNNKLLTDVIIPDGIISIGEKAFQECSELISITIPSSVSTIKTLAFQGCNNLKSVYITDLSQWCQMSFNVNYITNPLYYAHDLYINGQLATNINIPYGVIKIGDAAFSDCSVKEIFFPTSVISIGECSFFSCTNLSSIEIPSSIKTIGECAFSDCTKLKSVNIRNGLMAIGENAFDNCIGLSTISIPKSVIIMGESIFAHCENLQTIYCEAESKPEGWDDKWNINCNAKVIWGYKGGIEDKA